MHPVYTFPPYFLKIHSNIIFLSMPRSSKLSLPFRSFNHYLVIKCPRYLIIIIIIITTTTTTTTTTTIKVKVKVKLSLHHHKDVLLGSGGIAPRIL
jgi:phage FluMu protein Com